MAYYIAPPPCARDQRTEYVRARARTWMSDPTTVLLDTETTDLHGWPVQVSVIDATGRVLLDTLAHAPEPISPSAQAVHGISDDDLADAPDMRRVLDDLAAVLAGRRVLAYNARYDEEVLRRAYQETVCALPLWSGWGCVMELESWHVGTEADDGRIRAVPLPAGDHSALGDCRATLAVLRRLSNAR